MKRKLTTIILTLGLLGISLTALAQEKQTPKQKVEPPKVLAVLFYADSSCKELEPKLNKVKRDFEGKRSCLRALISLMSSPTIKLRGMRLCLGWKTTTLTTQARRVTCF